MNTDIKLHSVVTSEQIDEYMNKDCKNDNHGPYLFLNNLTDLYSSSCENRTIYRCACLKCGRISDYYISPSDKRRIIYVDRENNMKTLNEFNEIREKLNELLNNNIAEEEAISEINRIYQEENIKVKNKKI